MKDTNEKCETSREEKQDVLVLQGKPTGLSTNSHQRRVAPETIFIDIKRYD